MSEAYLVTIAYIIDGVIMSGGAIMRSTTTDENEILDHFIANNTSNLTKESIIHVHIEKINDYAIAFMGALALRKKLI